MRSAAFVLQTDPGGEASRSLLYTRSFPSKIFVYAVKRFVLLLLKVFFRLQVKGLQHLSIPGPYLICPNHLSDVDPLLLYSLLNEETLYIAYEANFRRPPLSWIIRFGRVLLTSRGGKRPKCLVQAHHGIQRGFSVCLFPEGGRTTTGRLMEPRDGAAILSVQSDAPIIPVLIEGSLDLLSHVNPGFRLCKISITFDKPIYPDRRDCAEILQDWKQRILRLQREDTLEVRS